MKAREIPSADRPASSGQVGVPSGKRREGASELLDHLDEVVFETDARGRWTFLNAAWERATHLPVDLALGRSFLDFVPPDGKEGLWKAFQALLRRKSGRLRREIRTRTLEGSARWIEVSARPLVDAEGKVTGTCGTLADSTSRHESRSALLGRERILRAILDHAPIGIWMLNRQGRLLFVNRAFCDSVGISEGRFLEVPHYAALLDPQMAANCLASDQQATDAKGPCTSFERFPFSDGELHDVEVVKVGLRNTAGVPEGLVGLSLDITERKRSEEALRASEERYRVLYDETPSMFFTLDREGMVLSVNDFGAGHLGYTPSELVGRPVTEIFLPEDRATVLDMVACCCEHLGGMQDWQVRKRRKDGSLIWVRETVRCILREGRPTVLVVCQDVSAAVAATEEKEQLGAQLHQSQKLEAMGSLASGIAHDFNNFLHVVLSSADLALEDLGPHHPVSETVANIRRAGENASELVKRILSFSRPGTQEFRPLALASAVTEALRLLRPALPLQIEFAAGVVSLNGEGPWIRADPTQITQVLVNLVTNAAHAMEGRPGRIELPIDVLSLGAQDPRPGGLPPGTFARLRVRDNGKGMSPEVRTRIFEPFFTTKAHGQGTGLGLSIVQRILQMHGGAIDVESVEGAGTTFSLYFPTCDPLPTPFGTARMDLPTRFHSHA